MATTILLYTIPNDPHSEKARALLTRLGQAFKEVNVSEDEEAVEALHQKTGQYSVPALVVSDDQKPDEVHSWIVGYEPEAIEQMITAHHNR